MANGLPAAEDVEPDRNHFRHRHKRGRKRGFRLGVVESFVKLRMPRLVAVEGFGAADVGRAKDAIDEQAREEIDAFALAQILAISSSLFGLRGLKGELLSRSLTPTNSTRC